MAAFSTEAFLDELDSFGKPPPPQKLNMAVDTRTIAQKLDSINLEKQKKIRDNRNPGNSNPGMISLGSRYCPQKMEEIPQDQSKQWRDQVLSANRPKNPWMGQKDSVEESREYARKVAKELAQSNFDAELRENDNFASETPILTSFPSENKPKSKGNGFQKYQSSGNSPYSTGSDHRHTIPSTSSTTLTYDRPSHGYDHRNGPSPSVSFTPSPSSSSPTSHSSGYNGKSTSPTGSNYSQPKSDKEFPRVDVLNKPKYSEQQFAKAHNHVEPQKTSIDRENQRPLLTELQREQKWRDLDKLLHRQDEQFSTLTQQIIGQVGTERANRIHTGQSCQLCLDPLYADEEILTLNVGRIHAKCFNCFVCRQNLRNKVLHMVDNRLYCEKDYLEEEVKRKAPKCSHCKQPIIDMILQALDKNYHPNCFTCTTCGISLDGVQFAVTKDNQPYCLPDYHALNAPRCSVCHKPILPSEGSRETVRLVALNKDFHPECFRCEGCSKQLGGDDGRCYPFGEHILCQECNLLWRRTGHSATTDL